MGLVPSSSHNIGGVTVSGTPAAGQAIVASGTGTAAWAYPPGYELSYTEITSPVAIDSITEAAGTTLISPGAITFDGAAVRAAVYAPYVGLPQALSTNNFMIVNLFEGATQIGRFGIALFGDLASAQAFRVPFYGEMRFSPSAGAHTYTVTAYCNSLTGSPIFQAGAGGASGYAPAFVRFTKV